MSNLGEILQQWRSRLSPDDVGIRSVGRRRVHGLRREEVAQLAGISADYLMRLEQGRVSTPSAHVLEGLVSALRLSSEERELLYLLGQRVFPKDSIRTEITPTLRTLLEQLQTPACVYDPCWTQLICNYPFSVLMGENSDWKGIEANVIYRYLVGAPSRVERKVPTEKGHLCAYIADLRFTYTRFPDDTTIKATITALCEASPLFQRLWNEHEKIYTRPPTNTLCTTRKTIHHPQLGILDLDCSILKLDGSDLRLVIFTAENGTEQAERVARLASLKVMPIDVEGTRTI